MAEMRDGYVDYLGFKTYYKIFGENEPGKKTLLVLHGGPGDCHNYLLPLAQIADRYGRQVVFYDQIGCGKSNIPHQEDDFYTYDLWANEFYEVRRQLGLDDIHVFGNSWGGMLAMYCAIRDDTGINSMVVNGSPVRMDTWLSEANRLIEYMPKDMQEAMAEAERTGNYETPQAQAAYNEYYRRHVVGMYPFPDYVSESFAMVGECYEVMQGASEFVVTGKMKDWDIREQVKGIKVPTLMLSGTNDEATPFVIKEGYDLIPNCEWALVQGAAHIGVTNHNEEYMAATEKFIERFE